VGYDLPVKLGEIVRTALLGVFAALVVCEAVLDWQQRMTPGHWSLVGIGGLVAFLFLGDRRVTHGIRNVLRNYVAAKPRFRRGTE
jgi:hypothetical protein